MTRSEVARWATLPLDRSSSALPAAGLQRLAPPRKEGSHEAMLMSRLHRERRERHGDRQCEMIALGAGQHGATERGVRVVHPNSRFDQPRDLGITRTRLELDAEPIARRAFETRSTRDHG